MGYPLSPLQLGNISLPRYTAWLGTSNNRCAQRVILYCEHPEEIFARAFIFLVVLLRMAAAALRPLRACCVLRIIQTRLLLLVAALKTQQVDLQTALPSQPTPSSTRREEHRKLEPIS